MRRDDSSRDADVSARFPEDKAAKSSDFYRCIPVWPLWAAGMSTFGAKFRRPFYVTSFNDQDYAVDAEVRWEGPLPVGETGRVTITRLDRTNSDEDYAWTWRELRTVDPAAGHERVDVIEVRKRLPEFLEGSGPVGGADG